MVNRNVPLPFNWNNFLALTENKADLEHFLSEQILEQAEHAKTIVVACGFHNFEKVESNKPVMDRGTFQECGALG